MWVDSVGLLDFNRSRSLLGLMANLLSFPSQPVTDSPAHYQFEAQADIWSSAYRAAWTRLRKSSAPRRRRPSDEIVTKFAPSLMNSAMPATSLGELPPTPTSLPPALILGMTSRMTCLTAAAPGFPMLCPRSLDATCSTSTPDTFSIASRLLTASVSSTMGMTSSCEFTHRVESSRVVPTP